MSLSDPDARPIRKGKLGKPTVQPVAAFEVADPAFGAGSVALQPSLGALGAGFLAAGDEHRSGLQVRERGVGGRARR